MLVDRVSEELKLLGLQQAAAQHSALVKDVVRLVVKSNYLLVQVLHDLVHLLV